MSIDEDLVEDMGSMTLDQSAAEDRHEGKEEYSQRMGAVEHQVLDENIQCLRTGVSNDIGAKLDAEPEVVTAKIESVTVHKENHDIDVDDFTSNKQAIDRRLPNAVLPLLRYYQYESSESSSRYMLME